LALARPPGFPDERRGLLPVQGFTMVMISRCTPDPTVATLGNSKTPPDHEQYLVPVRRDQALPEIRGAGPADYTGVPRPEYIDRSVQNLTRALRLVQQVLVILS